MSKKMFLNYKIKSQIIEIINLLPTLNTIKVTLDKNICQMHKCKHIRHLAST